MIALVVTRSSDRHGMKNTTHQVYYTPYEGLNLDNQISRKLGVFDRKLEGNHFIFHCYSDIY